MEQMAAENNWTELQMTTNVRPFWTADRVSQILAIFLIRCVEGCKLRHGIQHKIIRSLTQVEGYLCELFFFKVNSTNLPHELKTSGFF